MASNPAPMPGQPPSARRAELLELAYRYVVQRGRTDITLRPIAAAIGSSPRVLIYLFGSRDGLVRALLARSRAEETDLLDEVRRGQQQPAGPPGGSGGPSPRDAPPGGSGGSFPRDTLHEAAGRIWSYLADESRRPLLRLWLDGYSRSLSEPDGPWAGFGHASVDDWLTLLADVQPAAVRETAAGLAERTLVLAVLRGALLDLLSTDDEARVTAAVRLFLAAPGRLPVTSPAPDRGVK